jgi:hypothetical protein
MGELIQSDVMAAGLGASVQPGGRSVLAWIEPDGLTRFEDVPALDGEEGEVEEATERPRPLLKALVDT